MHPYCGEHHEDVGDIRAEFGRNEIPRVLTSVTINDEREDRLKSPYVPCYWLPDKAVPRARCVRCVSEKGPDRLQQLMHGQRVERWSSKVQSPKPRGSPRLRQQSGRRQEPTEIAPHCAFDQRVVLCSGKVRARRPHLHRRHRPTTATMPQEVKQKSGIAIGLNKGHVRPPGNLPPPAHRER